jgi:hypothetical protein
MSGSRLAIASSLICFTKLNTGGMEQDTGLDVLCCGDLQGTLEVIRDSHFHNFSCEP